LSVEMAPRQNAGVVSLRVDGPPGANVRVQRSSDLINWQDTQPLTLGEVPALVTDTILEGASRGFYRAVSP
jgi:hypothetical protein